MSFSDFSAVPLVINTTDDCLRKIAHEIMPALLQEACEASNVIADTAQLALVSAEQRHVTVLLNNHEAISFKYFIFWEPEEEVAKPEMWTFSFFNVPVNNGFLKHMQASEEMGQGLPKGNLIAPGSSQLQQPSIREQPSPL